MTELQLTRGATLWLRRLGLSFVALIAATTLTLVSINIANSAADGSDSEIDPEKIETNILKQFKQNKK